MTSRPAAMARSRSSGGMLVAATGGGVGMAEAGHQLALGGAGPGCEGASRVARSWRCNSSCPTWWRPGASACRRSWPGAGHRLRRGRGASPVPHRRRRGVRRESRERAGESDYSPAGLGLGSVKRRRPPSRLTTCSSTGDSASGQVEVPAPKREELAESQPSEAGEEDDRRRNIGAAVIASANSRTRLRANDRYARRDRSSSGASHPARVGLDEPSATAVERIAREQP